MQRVLILMKSLKLEGETTAQFAAELKKLTPEDKEELVQEGAKHLGVEIDPS